MSQTGFTPIQLYRTATASAVPTAGNLVAGELAINYTDGKLFYEDNLGVVQVIASKDAAAGSFTNLSYTGTLTGGTGVVNIGSGQIYKDASGNVGVGTTTPDLFARGFTRNLGVNSTGTTAVSINGTNGSFVEFGFNGTRYGSIFAGSANEFSVSAIGASTNFRVLTNENIRFTIDPAGNAGLGVTPSAQSVSGTVVKGFEVARIGSGFVVNVGNGNTNVTANAYFGSGGWTYANSGFAGYAGVLASNGNFIWNTAPSGTAGNPITFTQAMTLTQGGNLLVGTTTDSGARLKVNPTANEGFEVTTGNQVNSTRLFSRNNAGTAVPFEFQAAEQRWYNGAGSQNMTLTQGGNLLVGTTTDFAKLAVNGSIYAAAGNDIQVGNANNTNSASINSDSADTSAALVFKTAAAGIARAEAARITAGRYFKASNTGTYVNATGTFHEFTGADNTETLLINTTSTTAIATHTRLPVGSAGFHYIGELSATGTVYQVLANGNVQNLNNSYGAISDAKLKNLIGPAPSYWERYKLIEWVKYILKNDPTNQEQLGVIAQQVRGIFPGLIEETPDMHEVTKTREVTKTVPVTTTETQNITSTEIKLVNGKYVQVTTVTPTEVQVPVIDEFPVYDESGQPVMQLVSPAVEAQDAVLDDEGNELQPAVAAQDAVYAPLMHKVPRMQTITETETYTEMEPTGTVTLSVKYSILGHISDVVLQEAMARIEHLEQMVGA